MVIRFCRIAMIRPKLDSSRTSTFHSRYLNILSWITYYRLTFLRSFRNPRRTATLNAEEEADWNTIFNFDIQAADEANRRSGIASCSSNSHFNMEKMMKSWLGWLRCFFDLYIGQLCSLIGFNLLTTGRLSFQKSSGRFLVTGRNSPPQCGHKDFDQNEGSRSGFFIIATGAESSELWVADGSYKNFNMPVEAKRVISHCMEIKFITIPELSVFVWHGYLQYEAAA